MALRPPGLMNEQEVQGLVRLEIEVAPDDVGAPIDCMVVDRTGIRVVEVVN
jgi:hypothetical protein